MMLTCEKCQTNYMVKLESIPASGRSVKCVKCGHIWKQFPEGSTPPGQVEPAPESLRAIPRGAALPVIQESSSLIWLKLAVISTFIIAFTVSLALYQAPILQRIPALAPVYSFITLASTKGLTLQDISISKKSLPDQVTEYVLKGKLTNRSANQLQVPSLKISIMDKNRKKLETFVLKSSGEQIAANKTINFSNTLLNMPKHAYYLSVDIGNRAELLLR